MSRRFTYKKSDCSVKGKLDCPDCGMPVDMNVPVGSKFVLYDRNVASGSPVAFIDSEILAARMCEVFNQSSKTGIV